VDPGIPGVLPGIPGVPGAPGIPGRGLSNEGNVAPLTDTFTSIPDSPSSPLFDELVEPGMLLERDDAVSPPPVLPELDELLEDDELRELGMDGIDDGDEEALGIDGDDEEDGDELGIDGDDEEDGGEELGIDGMEELLELCCCVDSQPARTKPRVMAVARALSAGKGLLMLRSSTAAS
jgi:hypothetical protein